MTTLADFKAATVQVTVRTTYGKTLEVELRVPSFHKRQEIISSVPMPTVPLTKWDKEAGKKVPNYADEDYLREQADAVAERSYRLLTWALVAGGMDIPGDTLEAQTAAFRASEPDAGIVEALLRFITDAVTGARVEARADSFRPVHAAETAGVSIAERVPIELAGVNGR